MDDTVQFNAKISRSLDDRFRKMVSVKHPNYSRGALSFEVEQALANYLALNVSGSTHPQITNPVNPVPKVFHLKNQIKAYLREKHGIDTEEISQYTLSMVKDAIKAIKGIDPRTVEKWRRELERNGCLKEISPNVVELP